MEKMSAMMMEDWASGTIVPGYKAIRDARFVTYMTYAGHGSNNCGLTTWTPYRADCECYAATTCRPAPAIRLDGPQSMAPRVLSLV